MTFTSKDLLNSFVNIIEKEDREELDDDDIVVDFDDLIVENDKSEINNSQFKSKIKEKNNSANYSQRTIIQNPMTLNPENFNNDSPSKMEKCNTNRISHENIKDVIIYFI